MTITQIIGLIIVLGLAALCGFFIIKNSKKHDLVKWILLFILVAISLTWIFEGGNYAQGEFASTGLKQLGITDLATLFYYGIQFSIDKIVFIIMLGVLYGVLSKSEGYKKLVTSLAAKLKGKEVLTVLVSSLVFTALANLLNQTFVALVFVPFMISVLLAMKLDKITAFCATFGSVLIGLLGITYGGEGLYWFNQYTSATVTTAILYRLIVLVVAFILFNFFTVLHTKKVVADKKLAEVDADLFKVEKVDKKSKVWPVALLLGILFVFLTLSYISWENTFGITIFKSFHEWLTGLQIGSFQPFAVILGSLGGAFGTYTDLFNASITILVFAVLIALISRVNLTEFISGCGEGLKKFGLPLVLFLGTYVLMIAAYVNPFVPTITNTMFKHITAFNPFLTSLTALISNIFHADLGLTGLIVAPYFTTTYATNLPVIHTIFVTLYGFVQLCLPTSGILLIGLSYLNIEYKSWIKYSWMFIVAIFVILLVLFTVMTYV